MKASDASRLLEDANRLHYRISEATYNLNQFSEAVLAVASMNDVIKHLQAIKVEAPIPLNKIKKNPNA